MGFRFFLFVLGGLHAPDTEARKPCRTCWASRRFLSISLSLVVDVVCRNIRRIGLCVHALMLYVTSMLCDGLTSGPAMFSVG